MTDAPQKRQRWSVIAAGLLILALALVVIYTKRGAFVSPIAMVVVAAIGFAALLFQVRFRHDLTGSLPPVWLNILGLLCALLALTADYLKLSFRTMEVAAYAAIGCFGISGVLILQALRRQQRDE